MKIEGSFCLYIEALVHYGCDDPIDTPTPDLDCEKLLEIIQNFIIEYDCDKLNNGTPTNIVISITGQAFEDGMRTNVDHQTVTIPVNGSTENLEEFNSSGNATGVNHNGTNYSISDWNAQFTNQNAASDVTTKYD